MTEDVPGADLQSMREQLDGLVAEFLTRREDGSLSETTSEQDIHHLIDRLLAVLGWDINDAAEYSRQRYTRGAGTADAVLMTAGAPVCYVEVKRLGGIPPLNLLRQQRVYYTSEEEQALRYARRSVDLPDKQRWTILTNFEQLYLFEATTEERLMAFEDPRELVERFFDDTRYLSRGELPNGGLARWVHRQERPDVDEEFRETLNAWRLELAQDIYDRNKEGVLANGDGSADLQKLQRAVQRLLDRLVILQYATDLEAIAGEPLTELLERTEPAGSVLVRELSLREELLNTFANFDQFYNTSIFMPGHICEQVDIGQDVLRRVVAGVAGQNFRRFTSDILGATYEEYLGKVLEIDEEDQARLVTKPEVRRAGGIYYTPTRVVRHIVNRTLDPLLDGATEEAVSQLKILDPACGSGSFLVAAYEKLADWYEVENRKRRDARERYAAENPGQAALDPQGVPLPEEVADYHRRILESHLYGVDLDPDAAELASLNIIMTAIRRGMQGRSLDKLPAVLGQNIKIGNSLLPGVQSLVGFDLATELVGAYDELEALADLRQEVEIEHNTERERELLTEIMERTLRVSQPVLGRLPEDEVDPEAHRPFVWSSEFPEVLRPDLADEKRGFDCVIGNPPWIGFTGAGDLRPYLARRYEMCMGRFDIYVPFIELALRLLRPGGRFGMITPSNFFLRDYGKNLRPWLKGNFSIHEIVDFGDVQLFKGATNYPAILIIEALEPPSDHELVYLRKTFEVAEGTPYLQADLDDDHWIFLTEGERQVFLKMSASPSQPLSDLLDAISEGIITGQNKVFLLSEQRIAELSLTGTDLIRLCPRGQFIKRWSPVLRGAEYVVYPYEVGDDGENVVVGEATLRTEYPSLYKHLREWKDVPSKDGGLAGRDYVDDTGKDWYELTRPREKALLERQKIICPEIAAVPEFTLAEPKVFVADSATALVPRITEEDDTLYLVGILNSPPLARFHQKRSVPKANGYLIYKRAFLKDLPIRFPEDSERYLYDRIVMQVRDNLRRATRREELEIDFTRYIEQFPQSERQTINHWLESIPRRDRRVLSDRTGRLLRLVTENVGGAIRVVAAVRFPEVDYQADESDEELLLEARVPEPRLSFLTYYLRWAHRRQAFSAAGKRTLYHKVTTYPLPAMSAEDVDRAVVEYSPVVEEFERLTLEIGDAERAINEAVIQIYRIDKEDLDTLEISL